MENGKEGITINYMTYMTYVVLSINSRSSNEKKVRDKKHLIVVIYRLVNIYITAKNSIFHIDEFALHFPQ